MAITPRTGSPASIRPMLTAQSGSPWTMLPVPSIGSIDHRRGPAPPAAAYSSPVKQVVGEPRPEPVADQPFQVLIQVGHVAEVGLLLGRDPLPACQRHLGGLEGQDLDKLQLGGKIQLGFGRLGHRGILPAVDV